MALALSLAAAAAGCAAEPAAERLASGGQASNGQCGLGNEVLASETLTAASIPSLSALERSQIVLAVQESAHTDVTTVEEAFERVDQHEINRIVLWHAGTNQFYTEIEYGAGDNSYGAIFYWGTDAIGAAIHDGDEYECGPLTYNYDRGDVAAECAGFLTYANTATHAMLDAYLPSTTAHAIITARPFASVASVAAVHGVADASLQHLLTAARNAALVGPSCSGIHDRVAISTAEAAAMVALVNEASRDELDGRTNAAVAANLVAARPVASAAAIAAVSGVGPAMFRALRNAATIRGPWEELVDAVNAIDHPDGQIRIDTHFDWVPLVTGATDFSSMDCFGIAPGLLPPGATVRPTLGNSNEIMEQVGEAVAIANRFEELTISPTPGFFDLEWRSFQRTFFGCHITWNPNPWTYDSRALFVDTQNGRSLTITFHYVE